MLQQLDGYLRLAWMFENCFPNTLETTVHYRVLDGEVEQALREYAIVEHPKYGKIYAFEVDGFGNHLLMDDAARFTRAWFAWQNTLFGELVLKLIDNGKADLLNSLDD